MSIEDIRTLGDEYVVEPVPDGMLHAKWDGEKWVSDVPEIEQDVVCQPSFEERLNALEAATLDIIFERVNRA